MGNPMKSNQLTNFRSTGNDHAFRLTPAQIITHGQVT
jgi:hypothetical protein